MLGLKQSLSIRLTKQESLQPTYVLEFITDPSNEGDAISIVMNTTNVAQGTLIPYTITGIDQADLSFGSLTGNITIQSNGIGAVALVLANDTLTEGTETATVTAAGEQASLTINDTSTTPPTYALSSDISSVDEGNAVVFTMNTTNVANGAQLPYAITGISASDITQALSGNITINNNTGSVTIDVIADVTTEGVETMTMTSMAQVVNVTVNDTSISPPSFSNTKSILFDGIDDKIITSAEATMQSRSYSFWAKGTSTAMYPIFGHGDQNKGCFMLNYAGLKRPILYSGGAYCFWDNISEQTDGDWHHWVVWYNTGAGTGGFGHSTDGVKLYCDGALVPISNINLYGTPSQNEPITIGAWRQSGGTSANCKIDYFTIYDRELTLSEVQAIYNSGVPLDVTNLSTATNIVENWQFGEGDTYPTLSNSITSNDGTMTNMLSSNIVTDAP